MKEYNVSIPDEKPRIIEFMQDNFRGVAYVNRSLVDFQPKEVLAGIIETKRFEMPEQKISSVIQIEGAEFYVADEEPQNGNLSPDPASHHNPVRIVLQTENADELFANALKFGAAQICPMTTEEDGRIGKLKDPFGHVWEIGDQGEKLGDSHLMARVE